MNKKSNLQEWLSMLVISCVFGVLDNYLYRRRGWPFWACFLIVVIAVFVYTLVMIHVDTKPDADNYMIVREVETQGLTDIIVKPSATGARRLTACDRDGRRNLYEYDPETRRIRFIRPLGKEEK